MSSAAHALALPAYTIDEGYGAGIVRMAVTGFFDLATLARHFQDNEAFVVRWRAAGRPIRVLIDANDLRPHTPEGQDFVQRSVARIYRSGDRVAILVGSSLVKMQMRRAQRHEDIISVFVSEQAACIWLTAHG